MVMEILTVAHDQNLHRTNFLPLHMQKEPDYSRWHPTEPAIVCRALINSLVCGFCRACGRHHHADLPVHQHAEEGGTAGVGVPGVQGTCMLCHFVSQFLGC